MISALVLHASPGARGFPPSQVIPASIVTVLGTIAVLVAAVRYRQGRLPWLDRVAERAARNTGLPPWAALPIKLASPSLLVAGFGFYWDVAWHIDRGRDDGPFSTPAHYPIVFGLAGIGLAGLLAVILDHDDDAPIRLPFGLRSSVGGALILLCGVVALNGFPLDDVWHTLFGQDVTLWSPTHIQMIGGASLVTLAMWMLAVEGRRRGGSFDPQAMARLRSLRGFLLRPDVRIAGAVLIGLSTLQGEYDFGVPQFPPLAHPVLVVLAASIALVAARITIGPGGALAAAVSFLLVRGVIAVLVGPVLGRSLLHMPLYLGEAVCVELLARVRTTDRQLSFGALGGLLIGTVGLATEWGWSQLAMPLPWRAALLSEAVVAGVITGVAAGLLGGMLGAVLSADRQQRQKAPRFAAAGALAVLVAVLVAVVPVHTARGRSATLTLEDATTGAQRSVWVTAELAPADIADHPAWFHILAWQGGDGTWHSDRVGQELVPLHELRPGVWRSDRPVPVYGQWKSFLRLATDRDMESVPLYLPEDTAIPAPAVPASAHMTRQFVSDHELLQREAVGGSESLRTGAYLGLGLLGLAWIAAMALGAWRLGRVEPRGVRPREPLTVGA